MSEDPTAAAARFTDPQVNLYAHDLEASIRFYRDVLGFAPTFRTPATGPPRHVELQLGRLKLGLATFEALRQDHGISTDRGPPRGEVVLFTDDPDGAYGWAVAHGAPSVTVPHDFAGYVHSGGVADPDGNPVFFTTHLPLTRATEPPVRPTFKNHLYDLYAHDLGPALGFYRDLLGFRETFRAPKDGPTEHVELELGPLNLGVSTLEALERVHGLSGGGGPPRGEVVLWTADVDAAHSWLAERGAPSLAAPHDFAGTLRAAWVADPEGNPVQIVRRRGAGPAPPARR